MSDVTKEKPKYKKRLSRIKKKLEDFKADCQTQEGKAHTPLKLKNRLRWTRGGPYSKNGYFNMEKTSGRKSAYVLPVLLLEQRLAAAGIQPRKKGMSRSEQATLYTFDCELEKGRVNWLSSNHPYRFQAHHLIPDEILKEKTFTDAQWIQLLKLPYDINHGANIMLLPEQAKWRAIHLLPQHNGSHPSYNAFVDSQMSKVKNQLKNTDCNNPTPPPLAVIDVFVEIQDACWNMLRKEGLAGFCTVNEAAIRRQASTSAV